MGTILGLLGLIVFVACVIAVAAGVTWFFVKVFPAGNKPKPESQTS